MGVNEYRLDTSYYLELFWTCVCMVIVMHCAIGETGSPGIISIICHQVLHHPSAHGTSSMGKHWLANAHITKLNELTVLEVTELTSSMVDETAFTIRKRCVQRLSVRCQRFEFGPQNQVRSGPDPSKNLRY